MLRMLGNDCQLQDFFVTNWKANPLLYLDISINFLDKKILYLL